MKEMSGKMSDMDLIHALRRMAPETGSLHCLGCGHEHRCSLNGCAIIRQAVERLKELTAPPPNDPLTLEDLRKMDGEPVFFVSRDGEQRWGIIHVYHDDSGGCGVEVYFAEYQRMDCWNYGCDGWSSYRRKPEEGTS